MYISLHYTYKSYAENSRGPVCLIKNVDLVFLLPGTLVDISAGSGHLMESLKQGESNKGRIVRRGWFM